MPLAALALALLPQQLPEVVVREDDTRITQSCRIRIPDGLVIADGDGDGVIHIEGDRLTVVFEPGSVLRGAPPGTPEDTLTGIGIRVAHCADLTLRGLDVRGYKVGLLAEHVDGLRLSESEFSRNFRQHLKSTPEAEDGGDWLWPHDNDEQQWRKNYGAAVCIERSADVAIHGVRVREQQNGIILDRVVRSRLYDNDCSFLSGWGLAMWRSSHNVISRNAFDFCVRGYSHGVYNRGQDSAGILMFEQCSNNVFVENSATHGGDGFFSFAGREALGDVPGPQGFDHERAGCNDNLFYGNDFSYAPAHGLEITFSFGNRIIGNRFVGNAICGIWGGFSAETLIQGNHFEANGDMGYGLERGGVNIDHSRDNLVLGNLFRNDACGFHLWDTSEAFADKPWGQANDLTARNNKFAGNRFEGGRTGVHLRGDVRLDMWNNQGLPSLQDAVRTEGEQAVVGWPEVDVLSSLPEFEPAVFGDQRPVGARAALAGRENIIMTEWGPWDHRQPLVRRVARSGGVHRYEVLPAGTEATLVSARPAGIARLVATESGQQLIVEAPGPGLHRYAVDLDVAGAAHAVSGEMLVADWEVAWFATPSDPREDLAGFRAAAAAEDAHRVRMAELRLPYAMGGPAALSVNAGVDGLPGSDAFGTRAHTRMPLPAGRWKLWTNSDDGVRVLVDGEPLIDNWTWHAPTRDEAVLELDEDRTVEIVVEHFELNGYAILEFGLEPVRG